MTQFAAYIAQLNPMEQQVLHIAASHLESSFSLAKSIGFQEWQAEQQKAPAPAEQQPAPAEQQPAPAVQQAPIQRKIKLKKKLTPIKK
ncbi:MAG: hypothetical protein K0U12_00255 [Gammaproteobacteria bacterium]|nr:hypothetical protein [Gammaproteobacteria bacterium]